MKMVLPLLLFCITIPLVFASSKIIILPAFTGNFSGSSSPFTAETCAIGNYSYYNGSEFLCSEDKNDGGSSDGNNYTTGISFTGTTTKTLQISIDGRSNLSASFTDIDTDTNDGNGGWTNTSTTTNASSLNVVTTGTMNATTFYGAGTGLTGVLFDTGGTATGNYTFDTTTFHIDSTNNRIGIGTTSPLGALDVSGGTATFRGSSTPASGASLELSYTGQKGYVQVYNRTGSVYEDLYVRGKINNLVGTDSFIMSAGVTLNDGPKIQIINANSTGSPTHNGSIFFDYGTYNYDVNPATAKFALRVMNHSVTKGVLWADGNGYLGVGENSAPDTQLHVRGGTCIDDNSVCTDPGLGNLSVTNTVTIGKGIILTPTASPPAAPSEGELYADTSHAVCYYNSTAWEKLNTGGTGTCA